MGFILELQQPSLRLAVDFDIHKYRAGIVLLALLQIVEVSVGAQPACADSGKIHEVERLIGASEVGTHFIPEGDSLLDVGGGKRIVDIYGLKASSKGGMAAMIAPICVEDAYLRLFRVAPFGGKIFHGLHKVVGAHSEAHLPAQLLRLRAGEGSEAADRFHRACGRTFGQGEPRHVFLA